MHAASPVLTMSLGASGPALDECASTNSCNSLLIPLPPSGHLRLHRLSLRSLLRPHLSRLRHDGPTLPHLCL
ncbi:hypothetical protein B296_00035542 [Ensete ventricosum]|uniref:Uncharacterized protein n=1 Tax=Ensete ventricosum TaxID=4639 RepID=A0A426ZH35_ENSVE|nr:hypothetical protein B296_00035542 [Ensete ventricosum]